MKNFLFTISLLIFYFSSNAQIKSTFGVRGNLIGPDNANFIGEFILSVKSINNPLFKKQIVFKNSLFRVDSLMKGQYELSFALPRYKTKTIIVKIDSRSRFTELGNVTVEKEVIKLNEVTVIANKPLVTQSIDRLAYNVSADPQAKSQSLLEMVRKLPLVTLNADDEVQINGSSDFKILINGKPSSLFNRGAKDAFKNMPANNIAKIEIITTPSAANDAEGGSGGILNIVTVKKDTPGYTGNLSSAANSLGEQRLSANIAVKRSKLGLSLDGAYLNQNSPLSSSDNYRLTYSPFKASASQQGSVSSDGKLSYVNAELSYELNAQSLVSATVGVNGSERGKLADEHFFEYGGNGLLLDSYRLKNNGESKNLGLDMGLNYQLAFKKNKEQLLIASYKYSSFSNSLVNGLYSTERYNYNNDDLIQHNKFGSKEQTIQVNYIQPLKIVNIETGIKFIGRNNKSDFSYTPYNPLTGQEQTNNIVTNNYDYTQGIFSFFNSNQFRFGKYGIQAGFRIERTDIDAHFTSVGTALKQQYNTVIPAVSIQWKSGSGTGVTFGYTERIQRPSINQLNPFVDKSNPLYFTSGNPALNPVRHHSLDLNYTSLKKASTIIGLNYIFSNNTIQNLVSLTADTVTFSTYQNAGNSKNLGTYLSINYPLSSKMSLTINGRVSHLWINGFLATRLYNNQGFQGSFYTNLNYRFLNDWRASANVGTYSKFITLQGSQNAYTFSSLSVSKDLFKKKLSLSGTLNNPFQHYRYAINRLTTDEFIQEANYRNDYRRIDFGLSYRFGKINGSIKKNKKIIDNDDLKDN
ncbi:outer membrane receptor protein involved in Fe transport [Mucilaginibacter gracilis]|uniref:Outer membrane receptor protein involved in Fe transport n=1 Tax=Mucilaginibacter gracilis TaxID=423350 RepID=A0A495IVL8_9SPHI|nr:outer membrane beta-barrel family protein [Mucilaginibacter gracilis]RKR80523.1 outer membrane receptor protein involved in Fe transport [Mucilaginibacter gracilis]